MYKCVNLSIVALQREIQFLHFTGEKKKNVDAQKVDWQLNLLNSSVLCTLGGAFQGRLMSSPPSRGRRFFKPEILGQKKNVLQLVWTLPNLPEELLVFDVGPRHRGIHLSPAAVSLMGRWCWEEPCCPLPAPDSFLTRVHFHPCIPETANIPIYITLSFQTLRSTLCSRSPPHHQWQSV